MGAQRAERRRLGVEQERDRVGLEAVGGLGHQNRQGMRANQGMLHLEPILTEMRWLVHEGLR